MVSRDQNSNPSKQTAASLIIVRRHDSPKSNMFNINMIPENSNQGKFHLGKAKYFAPTIKTGATSIKLNPLHRVKAFPHEKIFQILFYSIPIKKEGRPKTNSK